MVRLSVFVCVESVAGAADRADESVFTAAGAADDLELPASKMPFSSKSFVVFLSKSVLGCLAGGIPRSNWYSAPKAGGR